MKMVKIQDADTTKCYWECGTTGTLTQHWWECRRVYLFGRQFIGFLQKSYILIIWCGDHVLWYPKELKNLHTDVYRFHLYIIMYPCNQIYYRLLFWTLLSGRSVKNKKNKLLCILLFLLWCSFIMHIWVSDLYHFYSL